MQLTVPPSVSQDIARAKKLLERNEAVRALDSLILGLNGFEAAHVLGRARTGVEFSIRECVEACNGDKNIRGVIRHFAKSEKASITYTPGEEGKLVGILGLLRKALVEAGSAAQRAEEEKTRQRRDTQITTAWKAMRNGELPKGRALLRKTGEEFGSELEVLTMIGDILIEFDFLLDAVPYLEQAIANFPRNGKAYGTLASCYITLREYEKAEKLYRAAIKEFGTHPKTMLNLGKLYLQWNKKENALEVLQQVLRREPDNKEAAELFAQLDR